jgi:hypothetical protein
MTKPNERTAARIKAACDRLMEIIPAGDRVKIESLVENVYITNDPPPDYNPTAEVLPLENSKLVVIFYVSQMKYIGGRDLLAIVAHEFGHVIAPDGMSDEEETAEHAAQEVVRSWGIEAAIRIVVTGRDGKYIKARAV